MARKANIWISPHGDDWAVKREKGQRSIVVTHTKKEAYKIAHDIGRKDKVSVITQGQDGVIQSNVSYGDELNSPNDKNR
jgi:hypothetical protein